MARLMIAIGVLAVTCSPAIAVTINYSTVIGPGTELNGKAIYVEDGATEPSHVVIQPGVELESLSIGGRSSVVMLGGKVRTFAYAHTHSSFTVLDGEFDELDARGPVQLNIAGGRFAGFVSIGDSRHTPGLPQATISGGTFLRDVTTYTGTMRITGGDFQRVHPDGNGIVEITGGRLTAISAWRESVVHYSGGEITGPFHLNSYGATVHVYGSDLVRSSNELFGILADGTAIQGYAIYPSSARIVLHNAPEPSALTLALTACFVIVLGLRRHGCHVGRNV